MSNPLIDSLQRAVEASPDDVPLRLHLAELLIDEGRAGEAVTHCATALQHAPADDRARALMGRALAPAPSADAPDSPPAPQHPTTPPPPGSPAEASGPGADAAPTPPHHGAGFDWSQAEQQFTDGPAPRFVGEEGVPMTTDGSGVGEVWEVERPGVTLADIGGLNDVKDRLEVAFLAPMRNPELRRMYGKSLRGGLLLYGPPGCGKTHVARAVAGEMGAGFLNVGLTDVLDMWLGNSEANLHDLFEQARAKAPCVVFLDELDAIGAKRSQSRHSASRGVVNQLLSELDGVESENEGVYVLAATNTPWDVDPALRRPGRLDRTVLVLPPDEPARVAILRHHMARRPVEGVDLAKLARSTDGFTGADLAHVCESAAERALLASVRSGQTRPISMGDFKAALAEVRPSAGPWFDMARNVVEYADRAGDYDDLRTWMKARRLL